ncbi:PHB depolymerase family esterase [uncultured Thiodictyon sp.]|uniref:extracellular catalytic domain type 1 short-chain-length polyhydroxyalkanoate depolymerase n=1 Tax=uncultured Thiodictyon sp. TaxID=1846217 RepID=UPI0025FCD534|nr:PHB depolymerase family esterase [uncultured Thiodictyon sp.]
MNEQILAGMREAMSLLQQDGAVAATGKIQQTLWDLMAAGTWAGAPAARGVGTAPLDSTANPVGTVGRFVPDLLARLGVATPPAGAVNEVPLSAPGGAPVAGQFLAGSFTNHDGTRAYKLYVPTTYRGQALPLVVMLHGCGQDPDDFAAGTRLNLMAEQEPCLVLYPAANGSGCWNWFNAGDQQRDQGEPAIIAGMTREIMATYQVDPTRVYCAGMSAGGAMAAIMGATYSDLYAAIGVHSGVPYAAATDMLSGMAVMRGGGTAPANADLQGVPIIVFHGDRDDTVHPRNSDQLMTQSIAAQASAKVNRGQAGTGHAYTQTVHEGPDGTPVAEQWLVHGAGHAWSGGSRRGRFTDGRGPDASREMMRFFAAQSRPAAQ